MPILVGIVQLLFANCFCIPSYVHQQLHSLDCQNFVHHNSLVFLLILGPLLEHGFIFERGPTIYKIVSEYICTGVCTLMCIKNLSSLLPPIFSLNLSPIQNLKEALIMSPGMYCIIRLSEIMRLLAFKSPLFYPSS